jgi:hemolysin activation/secretion protein
MPTQKMLRFLVSISALSLVGVIRTKPTQAQLSNCPGPDDQQFPIDGNIFLFHNYQNLLGFPNSFVFNLSQPGSINNAGQLAVGQEQTLSLISGTTINTGTVSASGRKIIIAAVPGISQVQLSQEGMVLNLKLNAANLSNNGVLPESLPGLLTGGNSVSATGVSVDANGQVWLTDSNTQISTEAGTAIVSGTIDASNPNSEQTSGKINILGEKIGLMSANINASGSNDGSTVLVGGDDQGEGTIPKTQRPFRNIYSDKGTVTLNATNGNIAIADSVSSVESKTGETQQENQGEIESTKIDEQQGQGNLSFTSPASSADVSKKLLDDSTLQLTQQPNPNEDPLLQPSPELQSSQLRAANPVLPTPTRETRITPPKAEQPKGTIAVRHSEVVGSTVFSSKELNSITQPLEGRSVTLEELQGAVKAITRLYQEKGYLTSQAVVPEQRVTDGVVRIQVIEGSLAEIRIEGNRRVNSDYIRRRIQLGAKTPLRIDQLENQLRLLRADPLFENLNATLEAGSEAGQSVLVVRAKEANAFYGNVSSDNYSPPNFGSERLGAELGYRNLTGNGDNLSAAYYRSTTGGTNLLDLNYGIPLNAKNGTLQLRAVINRSKTTEPFDYEGNAEGYDISFSQPLIRNPREEFTLALGLSFRDNQTFVNGKACRLSRGPDDNGVSRTRVFRLGQDYIRRDSQGTWGLRSQFSLGTGLLDATINESPDPDSRFFKWLGQVQRTQRLGENILLIAQADLQLTPDTLSPLEPFVIGGGRSVRGYRQDVRAGDNGFRFSLENRFTLQRNQAGESVFDLAPFFDMGAVWNHPDNPNKLPNQTFLASLGLGLDWEPVPRLKIRLDYAVPFIDLKDRGENAQDEGFYFSVGYSF